MRATLILASLAIFDYACGDISMQTRLSSIASSIVNNVDYIMLIPFKSGNLLSFSSGTMQNVPLSKPILSINSSTAASQITSKQTVWAVRQKIGLDAYVGYQKFGLYIYYAWYSDKLAYVYGFRSNDPGHCSATTSKLAIDQVKYSLAERSPRDNCLQESYINSNGVATYSFSNDNYDPRARPWYKSSAALGVKSWSPIYLFFSGQIGITYTIPLYNPDKSLAGVIGLDYDLSVLEKALYLMQMAGVFSYIVVSSTWNLVGTSTGETLSLNGVSPKAAYVANNTYIRESAIYLKNNQIESAGSYSYIGSDGYKYMVQVAPWSDNTATVTWTIVVVSKQDSPIVSNIANTKQTVDVIAADLTAGTKIRSIACCISIYLQGILM